MNANTLRKQSVRKLILPATVVALTALILATVAITSGTPELALAAQQKTSAELTVGSLTGGTLGYDESNGSLTDQTFLYQPKPYTFNNNHDQTPFTIQSISWNSDDDTLSVTVSPDLTGEASNKLTLHLDDTELAFKNASHSATNNGGVYQWDADLGWSTADTVELQVSMPLTSKITVTTGDVSRTAQPGQATGYGAETHRAYPYSSGGSITKKQYQHSYIQRYDIDGVIDDDETEPNSFVILLRGPYNTNRQTTTYRVDDQIFYLRDATTDEDYDHIKRWDAPDMDWALDETHTIRPILISRWGTAVSDVSITSIPTRDDYHTYRGSDDIDVRVTFSDTVDVDPNGTPPTIDLLVGSIYRKMSYQNGSGSNQLNFRYTVQNNDSDGNGVSVPASTLKGAISVSSGSFIKNNPQVRQDPNLNHRVDAIAPSFVSASVNKDKLTLDFNDALDHRVQTEPSSFAVTHDGAPIVVNQVTASGIKVELRLAQRVAQNSPVTVSYTPQTKPLKDRVGNKVAAFSNQNVINNTPAPLDASFPTSGFTSNTHTGTSDQPQVVFAFSRSVSPFGEASPSFSVTNGTISSVQSHEEVGLDHAYLAFITPDGEDDVYFTLVGDQACQLGGICAPDRIMLEKSPGIHVIAGPGQQVPEHGDLVAVFEDTPNYHHGDGSLDFRIRFNYAVSAAAATLRDDAMDITNASPTQARRIHGRDDLWEITIEPHGNRDITVVLPPTTSCDDMGAVCTDDDRSLANRSELYIPRASNSEPTEPPPAPLNLTAYVDGNRDVVLSWEAPDDDSVIGYQILSRRVVMDPALKILVANTGNTDVTYTDRSTAHGMKHAYRVKAINSAGVGPRSNYVNATP